MALEVVTTEGTAASDAVHDAPAELAGDASHDASDESKPKRRKALNPERREMAAHDAAIRRALKKAKKAGDVAKLSAMRESLGTDASSDASELAAGAASVPPSAPAPAAVVVHQRPGWPSAQATAEMVPLAAMLVNGLSPALEHTRYKLSIQATVILRDPSTGEETVTSGTLAESISAALAPVLAKHLPNGLATPEGMLALACLPLLVRAGDQLIDYVFPVRGRRPAPSPAPAQVAA